MSVNQAKLRVAWGFAVIAAGAVIWGTGSHLEPDLRMAHSQGTVGTWTAYQEVNGQWHGAFVSTSGTVTLPDVTYDGSLSKIHYKTTIPALEADSSDEVYPLQGSSHGSLKWVHDIIGIVVGTLVLIWLLRIGVNALHAEDQRARRNLMRLRLRPPDR